MVLARALYTLSLSVIIALMFIDGGRHDHGAVTVVQYKALVACVNILVANLLVV